MYTTEKLTPHIGLYVTDIETTIAFYNVLFGTTPTKHKPDYAKYELTSPGLVISFVEDKHRVNNGFGHLGIQVSTSQQLANKLAAIKNAELDYTIEEQVTCCYALQDKFWVNDPDGIRWEVYQFHKDTAHKKDALQGTCCTSTHDKTNSETTVCC